MGLSIDNSEIEFVDHTKFLGVWIDKSLNWITHTNKVILKIQRNAHLLYRSKKLLNPHAKKILYYTQIYSHISYGIGIWGPMANNKNLKKIITIQKKCLNCLNTSATKKILTIRNIVKQELLKFGWKLLNQQLPISLQKCALTTASGCSLEKMHRYSTRNKKVPNIPLVRNNSYKKSIFCKGISEFADLPLKLRISEIINYFVEK